MLDISFLSFQTGSNRSHEQGGFEKISNFCVEYGNRFHQAQLTALPEPGLELLLQSSSIRILLDLKNNDGGEITSSLTSMYH